MQAAQTRLNVFPQVAAALPANDAGARAAAPATSLCLAGGAALCRRGCLAALCGQWLGRSCSQGGACSSRRRVQGNADQQRGKLVGGPVLVRLQRGLEALQACNR